VRPAEFPVARILLLARSKKKDTAAFVPAGSEAAIAGARGRDPARTRMRRAWKFRYVCLRFNRSRAIPKCYPDDGGLAARARSVHFLLLVKLCFFDRRKRVQTS
jgi:hypothetical protein